MSYKRAKTQTFIGIWIENSLMDKIDQARGLLSRSQFARNAIGALLRANGFDVVDGELVQQDRVTLARPSLGVRAVPASSPDPSAQQPVKVDSGAGEVGFVLPPHLTAEAPPGETFTAKLKRFRAIADAMLQTAVDRVSAEMERQDKQAEEKKTCDADAASTGKTRRKHDRTARPKKP